MVYLSVPSIPPSANHAYFTLPGGKGRGLSDVGKKYKLETTTHLIRKYREELKYFEKNQPYTLLIHFQFADKDTLYCKGYPKQTDSRYKKLDVSNRLKLFEDALVNATAIDDAQHWIVAVSKATGPQNYTHIWAWNMEHGTNPFTNTLETLLSVAGMQ